MKLAKVILESSYRVLQVTPKWKKLKPPVQAVKFWAIFDILIEIALATLGISCETTLFRKPTNILIKRSPITK